MRRSPVDGGRLWISGALCGAADVEDGSAARQTAPAEDHGVVFRRDGARDRNSGASDGSPQTNRLTVQGSGDIRRSVVQGDPCQGGRVGRHSSPAPHASVHRRCGLYDPRASCGASDHVRRDADPSSAQRCSEGLAHRPGRHHVPKRPPSLRCASGVARGGLSAIGAVCVFQRHALRKNGFRKKKFAELE